MKTVFFIAFILLAGSISAQKLTISGTILDINGTPVENAIIEIDGHETSVHSDTDGKYIVKVRDSAERIGVVAFGIGILEEEIAGRTQIDFLFSKELVDLPDFERADEIPANEQVVNTGYNSMKRKFVIGTVGFLDVEHSKKKYSSIEHILMETPGLVHINGMYIVAGSYNFKGYVLPLYVVDGVENNGFPYLTPSQVATVTVLKGSEASIYGSRAFGGVIIITTRIP
jgi:TonB-dependent starch-binding outer membrane protein SusC